MSTETDAHHGQVTDAELNSDSCVPERQKTHTGRPLPVEQIRTVIRERISRGTYPPGSAVPTELDLAKQFGVSAAIVRTALRPLKADGTLYTVPGGGTFVSDPQAPRPAKQRNKTDPIERSLRKRLSDGTYAPRTWLPPTQELAAEFDVSLSTVSTVLESLNSEKLVGAVPGAGTYVIDPQEPTALPEAKTGHGAKHIERIRTVIRDAISSGTLSVGTALPTERDLVKQFGVSTAIMRTALRPLKDEGTLYAVPGGGTFVSDPQAPRPAKHGKCAAPIEGTLRKRLSDGTYAPLTWLPPARELAAEFGVATRTVGYVLESLRSEKLVGAVRGAGTYVIDPQEPSALPEAKTGHGAKHIERIRTVIREAISSGTLSVGTALTERDLAKQFGVSTKVVHTALQALKDEGTLHAVLGQGTFVSDPQAPRPAKHRKSTAPIEGTLRKRLSDGTYAPLTWLPPLQELAAEFRVSPNTLLSVVDSLRSEKLLGVVRGTGTYVIDPQEPAALPEATRGGYKARQIEQAIRQRLGTASGYQPGSKIPKVSELADEFDVSEPTIRAALKPLKREGLLFVGPRNSGTYVARHPPPAVKPRRHAGGEPRRI